MKKFGLTCLTGLALLGLVNEAEARVGTWDVGYGTKSRGMGGVAVALAQDSMVGATNPAGVGWIGDRLDLGAQMLSAPRIYSYSNPDFSSPFFGGTLPSQGKFRAYPEIFVLPEAGITQWIDDDSLWGAALYTGGGESMYKRNNPIASLYGTKPLSQKLGIQLDQYFLALSYARWITPWQSVGLSLVTCAQWVNIRGLHAFDNAFASASPHHVTNRGRDWAGGAALRFGYLGEIWDGVTLGASYTTRTAMTRFKKYKGIITDNGRLEVPATLAAGVTWDWLPCSEISFEWNRLFYRDIPVWHNSINNFVFAGGTQLAGTKNGPGFGWKNIDVYKVGADYEWDCSWKFRGGYCLSQVPYKKTELDVNILTQNMARHHITLGLTYRIGECSELDIAYFHMFRTSLTGPSQLTVPTGEPGEALGLGTVTQRMYQDSVSVNYGCTW